MTGRFSVEAVFKAVDRVTAPVTKMQNRVQKFTRSMQRNFTKLNRVVRKMGDGLKKGFAVGTAALVGLGAAMVNVISVGADFGRAIGSAAAKFPDKIKRGTKEFKALEEVARRVGSTTEFTATQAAQGLNFLAKAGFDAKFSIAALPDIVDFATASEMDFAEAADIASDAIGAFGLDSKDTSKRMEGLRRTMDVMSKTANSTNTSVSELFEAVKKGAPVAVKAGQSIETFAAVAGTLASVGIKGSEAGTATKNIALALAGVGNQAGKTFKKLGIAFSQNGKMRDVAEVFEDLNDAIKDMDDEKMLGVVNAIFGKISLASAANLLGEGTNKIRELRTVLESAQGSTKTTAAFIRNDVKGSIDGLKSAIDGVKISIFSMNEGPLKAAIDNFTKLVQVNEELIAKNVGQFFADMLNNLPDIFKWLKRISIAIGVFITLSLALKSVGIALAVISLLARANPIGLLITGLVAGAALIIQNWTPIKAFFIDLWDSIVFKFEVAINRITFMINKVKKVASNITSSVSGFFGFGDDTDDDKQPTGATGPQIVTPQDRVARSVEESRTTSTAEVTIKDETGRAEVTGGKLGTGLQLQQSGAL